MRKKKAIAIPQIKTLEDADAHQRKHGFKPLINRETLQAAVDESLAKMKPKRDRKLRDVPKMNKTEESFSLRLEAQKRRHEIERWTFQGMTLQWGGLRYTVDFYVLVEMIVAPCGGCDLPRIRIVETKGGFLGHGDAIVKFKAAREHFKEFEFEFWQREKGTWTRLL